MWGVAFGLLLISSGVLLLLFGLRSLDGNEERRTAALFASVVTPPILTTNAKNEDDQRRYEAFKASESFAFTMDAPTYTSFYLWNLTNSDALLQGATTSPTIQEIGPYTYEKQSCKVNIQFSSTPFQSTIRATNAANFSVPYGYVGYQVQSKYAFVPERSNGSEADVVVTVNSTYVQKLAKLTHHGYSERFLLAEFAQQHFQTYIKHLRQEFLASTKRRAWTTFLPQLVQTVQRDMIAPVIKHQRAKVDAASLPSNLIRMHALARTEMIPKVLKDVHHDISDRFLATILQENYDRAITHAFPRVLSTALQRLRVENVPLLLRKQLERQRVLHVPMTLRSLNTKLQDIAFPYVMQEVFDRACLEAVPSLLRTIKQEIIARDIAVNRVQANVAQHNVVEKWRKQDSTATNFDAWIDDSPTGSARTGFELLPRSSTLQLSSEVAELVLGSKSSNLRFSIVDYNTDLQASYPLDIPTETPVGFALWKQIIALNETAITFAINGINNDVALTRDYITRAQVLFLRTYLITWSQSSVLHQDRERFWRNRFTKRTTNSDLHEPDVDLDIEQTGIQTGFNLQATGASTSGVTAAIATQIWSTTDEFSFVNPIGFSKWLQANNSDTSAAAIAELKGGIVGLTSDHIVEILSWMSALMTDNIIKRRALRHWSEGTCYSVLRLPLSSCLRYDLEPGITGDQTGFEMNPNNVPHFIISQELREILWNPSRNESFLLATYPPNTQSGISLWLQALRTSNFTRAADSLQLTELPISQIQTIAEWLDTWITNALNELNVLYWWCSSTCLERRELSSTVTTSVQTSNEPTCSSSYQESELSSVLTQRSDESPFFTFEKVFSIDKTTCDYDSITSTYTKKTESYTLHAETYSCDTMSTSLVDDTDDSTTGFELMPLVAPDSSDRISLAAAIVLWDSSNSWSFLHVDGYKQWATSLTDMAAQLTALNDQIDVMCPTIHAGGVNSAIFNTTLTTTVLCRKLTTVHLDRIQSWVQAQSAAKWVNDALLDQWRRGTTNEMDLELYRDGKQNGWELASGCQSSCAPLTVENGTMYLIPRDALQLWNSDHDASFISDSGFLLWEQLANATRHEDGNTITTLQGDIAASCGLAAWETWLEVVFQWLQAWRENEYLQRDVIGHWMHAQCPTVPVVLQEISSTTTSTIQSSCPNEEDRYSVTLNESIWDLQFLASRPTLYFTPEFAETSALVQPSKVVQVNEFWISCDEVNSGSFTITTLSVVSNKEYHACNFLSILASTSPSSSDGSTMADSLEPIALPLTELPFEMNLTTAPAELAIEIALVIWDQSSAYGFTNVDVFEAQWQAALFQPARLQALEDTLNAEIITTNTFKSKLTDVQTYLKVWEGSTTSTHRVAEAWLSQKAPYLDLDTQTDGSQTGFELFPSIFWKEIAENEAMPTLDQAQYLWGSQNTFSFLNTDGELANKDDLPTGFRAWTEIYDGTDYSSEELIPQYPLLDQTQLKQTSETHVLTQEQQASLLEHMAKVTSLSSTQLRGIAAWLMNWANNLVLRNYVLSLWATGVTPRGEADAAFNLADYLDRLYGFKTEEPRQDLFTVGSKQLASISKTVLRNLWGIRVIGSLVNPASRVIWCAISIDDDGPCPDIVDEIGRLSDSFFKQFVTIVQPTVSESITKQSNITRLALASLQTRLLAEEEELLVITRWWRNIPQKSLFFQVNQIKAWRNSTIATTSAPSIDPIHFGYDLQFVLPWDRSSKRDVTHADLVPNMVDLADNGDLVGLNACNQSLELLLSLWNESDALSFLNYNGSQLWFELAMQMMNNTQFLELSVTTSRELTSTIDRIIQFRNVSKKDVSCVLQSVVHWVHSWYHLPTLHQFVEFLWFQDVPSSTPSYLSSPRLVDVSDMVRSFPLTMAIADTSDQVIKQWVLLSRIILDPDETPSMVNLTHGLPLWKALLVNCQSSDESSAKCKHSLSSSTYKKDMKTASTALKILSREIYDCIKVLTDPIALFGAKNEDTANDIIASMVQQRVVPWMESWLDHPLLYKYVVNHVREVNDGIELDRGADFSLLDLAMIQFANGSVTQVNYSYWDNHDNQQIGDFGVVSEHISREEWVFDVTTKKTRLEVIDRQPGFGELRAFCKFNGWDYRFAYDKITICTLDEDYYLTVEDIRALWDGFTDDTRWEWEDSDSSLSSPLENSTRTALLIDAFLAQPFKTVTDCEFLIENIATAYKLSDQEKSAACTTIVTAGEIYLHLPMLSSIGFESKPLAFTKDFQAYLRYVATKFRYELSVLGLKPSIPDANVPSASQVFPLGGYLAVNSIGNVLFPLTNSANQGEWKSAPLQPSDHSVLDNSIQVLTMQIPLGHDTSLFARKIRVVGELLMVDNATNLNDGEVDLSTWRVTDGSQFTTAVLSRSTTDFPEQLYFYWPYLRRIAEIDAVGDVMRFGIALKRYTVSDWANPTIMGSGIINDDNGNALFVNMSLLYDDLPLALGLPSSLSSTATSTKTAIDIDPITGVVYHRRLVWQLNARLTSTAIWHPKLPNCWLPILWIKEELSISPTKATALATVTKPGPFAKEKVAKWEIGGGCVYIIVGCVLCVVYLKRARMMRLVRLQKVQPDAINKGFPHQGNSESPSKTTDEIRIDDHTRSIPSTQQTSSLSITNTSQKAKSNRKTQRIETIVEQSEDICDTNSDGSLRAPKHV